LIRDRLAFDAEVELENELFKTSSFDLNSTIPWFREQGIGEPGKKEDDNMLLVISLLADAFVVVCEAGA